VPLAEPFGSAPPEENPDGNGIPFSGAITSTAPARRMNEPKKHQGSINATEPDQPQAPGGELF